MPRILSIDYGLKRTGIAVTDPLQIIATGLTTIQSGNLIAFLKDYFAKEQVELIIIGEPKNWDDSDTHATPLVERCIKELNKNFPHIPLKKVDERYTSNMARDAITNKAKTTEAIPFAVIKARFTLLRSSGFTIEC